MRTRNICLALVAVLPCADARTQWVQSNGTQGAPIMCLSVSGTNLLAGTLGGGVYISTDTGTSWKNSPGPGNVFALAGSGTIVFAGTSDLGIFLSTDNGTSWTDVDPSSSIGVEVSALAFSGTSLFAGTGGLGLSLSTNNGISWTPVNSGMTSPYVHALAVSGTNLFAGTLGEGVFLSTNNGASWTAVDSGLSDLYVYALAVSGTNIFAGTRISGTATGGVFRSTNNGRSWTACGLTNMEVLAFAVSGSNLFAGTFGDGVFLSTNNGADWTAVDSGLTDFHVNALAICGMTLVSGMRTAGLWERPLSEMITSVAPVAENLPYDFTLCQNYPNPFNPNTIIRYEVPRVTMVRLSVYDILGREVSVLVNERKNAGNYEVRFDGSNLASGVYLYKIQAGDLVRVKKMLVVK